MTYKYNLARRWCGVTAELYYEVPNMFAVGGTMSQIHVEIKEFTVPWWCVFKSFMFVEETIMPQLYAQAKSWAEQACKNQNDHASSN